MALAYTAPTWENGGGVGISASQLQALSDCMEGLVQGSDKAITNIAISGQTITLTFADGSEETGTASGLKGISSIAKTGTSGNVDTYTITYTDGSTSTFTVTNGADGSFYIVTAGIKSTDDPYGNIEYYIGGDFYKNGVLYNQSAYFKVTLVNESDYPPTPYLVDGSSGTFTNGHYSTGSIGAIPSGATITTQIFTDSTMTTLLGEVKVLIGLRGSEGEQGPQGPAGDDGVSPEVTITTITGGHRVNITDADHPIGQSFDVMDGTNTVVPNPQGTSVGDLTSIGINGDKYDIQGGGSSTLANLTDVNISSPSDGQILQYDAASQKWVNEVVGTIPIGSIATPTDDIQTWLHCAAIWNKNYTLLSEVLADSTTLLALISMPNAVDYMTRSITWASGVTANNTAMSYIGANDYCSNELLADNTWRTAIGNSTYFEQVLNVKVPVMTSDSDKIIYSGYSGSYYPWNVFDNNDTTAWFASQPNSSTDVYVGYDFGNLINCYKVKIIVQNASSTVKTYTHIIEGSNDNITWNTLYSTESSYTGDESKTQVFDLSTSGYRYYRLVTYTAGSSANYISGLVKTLQFYGRA